MQANDYENLLIEDLGEGMGSVLIATGDMSQEEIAKFVQEFKTKLNGDLDVSN